jgi:imidazolonepropionase-like amidohydrolase
MPIKMMFIMSLFSFALYGCTGSTATPVEVDYLFENVNVVPMDEESVHRDKAVAVRDGRVVAVMDQGKAHEVAANHRIDGGNGYIMPGLADMHVHVRWAPRAMFKLFLANGVTTVFNMGLADGGGEIDHLQLRSDVAEGAVAGPRYRVSGPQLRSEALPDVGAVAPVLARHVDKRFDTVKIHGNLEPEVYDALIEGARARGLRVTGHAQHLMPLSASLRVAVLEHGQVIAQGRRDELAQRYGGTLRLHVTLQPDATADALAALTDDPRFAAAERAEGGVRVSVPEREAVPELIALLVGAGVRLYGATLEEPSLEDVYFALHGRAEAEEHA